MSETNTTTPEVQNTAPAQAAPVADQPTATDDGPKKINRSEIDDLFTRLSYAEVSTWTEARLAKKIRTIEPILEKDPAFLGYRDKLPQNLRDLYEELKKIVSIEDASINIIEDRAGKAAPAKKGKAAKAPKPAKATKAKKAGTPPAKDPGVKRDAFGCAVTADTSKGMAVLTKDTPLKMSEIVDKGGLKGTIYNFLNDQVEKGNVLKTDKGYKLTAAGQRVIDKHNAAPEAPATPAAAPVAEAVAEAPVPA